MTSPQILYVDAYDSFSNNIVALLRTSISANVYCVKIDDSELSELENEILLGHYLSRFDAVVVGPGPGNPTLKKDVGWIDRIWKLPDSQMLPVFGICLGFQSLCHAFGGQVLRLKEPRHGLVLQVDHNGRSIFNRLEPFNGTMYHSLHVSLGNTSRTQDPWLPSMDCPYLEPLAWDLQDVVNGPVLMGVKHVSKPFCGVQFHPESVVTGAAISQGNIEFLPLGANLVQNWWNEAQHWNSINTRTTYYESPTRISLHPLINCTSRNHYTDTQHKLWNLLEICGNEVTWNVRNLHHITVQHIFQELKFNRHEGVLLESGVKLDGSPLAKDTGRYSIIGVVDKDTVRLQYFVKSSMIVLHGKGHEIAFKGSVSDFWDYLKRIQEHIRCTNGSDKIPFWGGFMGFVSYEAGLAGINIAADSLDDDEARPDISFVLVLRSVVVDHERKIFYTQSIGAGDGEWVLNTSMRIAKLDEISGYESPLESSFNLRAPPACSIGVPDYQSYLDKVGACDVAIRAGDSYELCLTNQIKVKVSKQETRNHESSWNLYKKLSERNTAPFGVYLNINHGKEDLTVIGSSPERFMSWSRKGKCQFRPIKGTVKKLPGMTLNEACEILRPSLNSKDVAENLMITDLVRHDLNGIVQLGSVHVPKLFEVEEYKTVFQLVSVIEGQLQQLPKKLDIFQHPTMTTSSSECPDPRVNNGLATPDSIREIPLSPADSFSNQPNHPRLPTGIDVLAASLPPGSMTGAPKKRSCEILQDIEEHIPRGIYSGVIGYLDVGGGGDFSVVIRTAWKWSGDEIIDEEGECEIWRVGAGGAVTSQSTPEGEADEMQTKLSSVTAAFRVLTSEPNRGL